MSKSIRVDEDTHAALVALKGDSETFDELLSQLVRERRESVQKALDAGREPTQPTAPGRSAGR